MSNQEVTIVSVFEKCKEVATEVGLPLIIDDKSFFIDKKGGFSIAFENLNDLLFFLTGYKTRKEEETDEEPPY